MDFIIIFPPLYRRLGGPQGRSGQVRKISHPTGIRSPDLRLNVRYINPDKTDTDIWK